MIWLSHDSPYCKAVCATSGSAVAGGVGCTCPLFTPICVLLWLLLRGQVWIVQVMLAPLLMGALLAALTLFLSHLEYRR